MNKFFLFFLFVIAGTVAGAQELDPHSDSVICAYEEKRYADVVALEMRAAQREPRSSIAMLHREFAHRINIEGQPEANKKEAIRAALFDGDFSRGAKRVWGVDLAEYFLNERRYDSALYILDYSRQIPDREEHWMEMGDFWIRHRYALMRALNGLGRTDTAIQVFAPQAFFTADDAVHWEKINYAAMVADFVQILRHRYSSEVLAKAAGEMVSESGYVVTAPDGLSIRGEPAYVFTTRFLGSAYKDSWRSSCASYAVIQKMENDRKDRLRCSVLYQLLRASLPLDRSF